MDDLDHSIHIAEYDWSSFYDESEECNLLQASLAYPDDSGLSDLEDSGNSDPAFSTDRQQAQESPDLNSNEAKSNHAEESCRSSTKLPEQLNPCETRGPVEEAATFVKEVEKSVSSPGANAINTAAVHLENARESTDVMSDRRQNTQQTDPKNVQSSGEMKDDLRPDLDPLPQQEAEPNMNQPGVTETYTSDVRAEKERWFVTVNDSPVRQRGRSTALGKKRKQKKTCDGIKTCGRALESSAYDRIKIEKDKHESGGGRKKQSNQNKSSSWFPSDTISVQVISDLPENQHILYSSKETISSPATTSGDTCTPSQLERVQSDESADSDDFLSIHSSDSESCFSASESVEEPQHPFQDHLMETRLSKARGEQMGSCASTLSRDVTGTDCEGYKSPGPECSLKHPTEGQVATEVPDDVSTCKNDMHSEAPGPQTHAINLSASTCAGGDQPSPLPVPDLAGIPCSAAHSPETYAKAAGDTNPVYVISPFWDEMEKLTINDILQLRMSASSPLGQTLEIMTPNADDIFETSDTGDSDYSTQPDESKPEQSSCKFSTSDFEEENYQFVGRKRNPSDSSFVLHEGDCSSSEERETPVPLEDFVGQYSGEQSSGFQTLWPMQIADSRSMYSAEALTTDELSFLSLFGNEEINLFLSSCQPLEKNIDLIAGCSLETLIPASVLSYPDLDAHHQMWFPEIVQCSFMEDKANIESQCVTVYDAEDISVVPAFDFSLCTIREHISPSSLHCSMEKPIPIFSSCHPTIRELTFPKQQNVFLSANCEEVGELSPIRVVYHCFIQAPAAAVSGSHSWKSLLSFRKIRFQDKGSIWCCGSSAWTLPAETEEIQTKDRPTATVSEGNICPDLSQGFRDLEDQQRILETVWTRREGLFSTVKQSDMCLVCIAFASWVLKSSDPKAADAWKAALLANVSALSAIQYLRLYMKRKNSPQDDL